MAGARIRPMSEPAPRDVTKLLKAATNGDGQALEELAPLVYDELKRLARQHLRAERPGHTLGATGLVHEAFLKLVGQTRADYTSRSHFFAVASMTMRRILVNWARSKRQLKRGGGAVAISLEDAREPSFDADPGEVLAIDTALERFAVVSERGSRIVECRYFGGLTIDETAEALGVSKATVKREWSAAKTWLKRELSR